MRILNYVFMALAAISSLTHVIISIVNNQPFVTWGWPLGTLAWVAIAFMNARTIEGYEKSIEKYERNN